MAKGKLTPLVKIYLLVGAIALLVSIFVPIWRIDLTAPQYPEGLSLLIFSHKLGGNVDVVNGLNHYIGMRTLHTEDFIEFSLLPYLIGFFVLAFLLVAFMGKRIWLNVLLILFISFGIMAVFDFWRWEYNYGHNLNPDAPIIVPGMSYDPPLIGFKQLLNFGAYSIPALGGWLFIFAGVLLLFSFILSHRQTKKESRINKSHIVAESLMIMFCLQSCTPGPKPILAGKDNCAYCTMMVTDLRYCSEIVTRKGKIFKFDDSHCLISFLHSKEINEKDIEDIYFTDFSDDHQFIKASDVIFLSSDSLNTPMNGNLAAFNSQQKLDEILKKYPGKILTWNDIQK